MDHNYGGVNNDVVQASPSLRLVLSLDDDNDDDDTDAMYATATPSTPSSGGDQIQQQQQKGGGVDGDGDADAAATPTAGGGVPILPAQPPTTTPPSPTATDAAAAAAAPADVDTSMVSIAQRNVEEKVERLIGQPNVVVVFGRTWCPYCRDALALLTENFRVRTHFVETNIIEFGLEVVRYLKLKTSTSTSSTTTTTQPEITAATATSSGGGGNNQTSSSSSSSNSLFIFVRGRYIGGCEELYVLWKTGDLEREILTNGLITRKRSINTECIQTAALSPIHRGSGEAVLPLFQVYPFVINNHVTRVTSLFVFALSIVNACFFDRNWAKYLATSITIDCMIRFVVGPSLSALSMLSTLLTTITTASTGAYYTPSYVPGAPKQVDACITMIISLLATIFFYTKFYGHTVVGCILMVLLAICTGIEGFINQSLGYIIIELGIHLDLVSDCVYTIYNTTLYETIETDNHKQMTTRVGRRNNNKSSATERPVRINCDRTNPIGLRYKRKSDEWVEKDFDPIRHLSVTYMYCPLSMAGLAMAFRLSSQKNNNTQYDDRTDVISHTWFRVTASIAAFVFVFMLFMYLTKSLLYFRRVRKEFNNILSSTGFAAIFICCIIFGFLCYDRVFDSHAETDTSAAQILGRVFFWIGSVNLTLFTIKVIGGEWIGQPNGLDLDHIYTHWLIFPTGFGVAAFAAPVVGPFSNDNPNSVSNPTIANFFYSFGLLLWIVLFTITFFKFLVTGSSSGDTTTRQHGVWFWVACPATLGYAAMSKCVGDYGDHYGINEACSDQIEQYFFIALLLFLIIVWSAMPHIGFFGGGSGGSEFTMAYWIDCFALDVLAVAAALFYLSNGWTISAVMEFTFLAIAALGNLVALLHTLVSLIRRNTVATPVIRLDPLSFSKLMHDAIKENLPTLQYYLQAIDLDPDSSSRHEARDNLGLFAAHFHRFIVVHGEHINHQERVIYEACAEFFPEHGKKFHHDHRDDRALLLDWCELADTVLDTRSPLRERKDALERLRAELPPFFSHLIRHFTGEEENIDPIVQKYFPLELKKELARQVWAITPAENWELVIGFALLNLPRHEQRVSFLRSLLWGIPERSQQVGAIVYRNVDAVMWERLRIEIREMIPRGAAGWVRNY